jgi:peptidoglycan/xylan/chitin deacetylase (PgdA/CDA1 family)
MILTVKKIALAILFGMVFIYSSWKISSSRDFQVFGEIINRVDTPEKVVALTFDDGPSTGFTQQILKILENNEVKASFFLVGEAVDAHPEETNLIIQSGHEVGNHSYTHQRMLLKSSDFIRNELERTDTALRTSGAKGAIHFRPPYGKKLLMLPYYLFENDIITITWDVEPETYAETRRDSASITQHVIEHVKPGSIVLLHVMFKQRATTMNAVPGIIDGLKKKGYRFVTVSELLEFR